MAPDTPADGLTAELERIRERADRVGGGVSSNLNDYINSAMDVPRLLGAVEAVLKLPDEWDAESDELDNLAEKPGTDEEGRPVVQGQAIAYHDCAQELREAITQALSGNPGAQEAQRGGAEGG